MRKRYKIIFIIGVFTIVLFILFYRFLYSTPILAIRTTIFLNFHPIQAFTDDIYPMKDINDEIIKSSDGKVYYSFPGWEGETGYVCSAAVKKVNSLYQVTFANP
ncbi:hypothetical protein ACH0R4_RS05255 [Bacillus cytotoxicus]|uniref:hypothetical protein n=1 Tax=Bacillus cereus group sp. BfR-BA-01492 TaxID=2920361 RepID=UPI001F58CBC2|nr:hypothetical protein [Bacillus cereus group sp. BfR-BA-01492]EMA6342847.1 hypothetical protein [Bacillus cytotoxicus]